MCSLYLCLSKYYYNSLTAVKVDSFALHPALALMLCPATSVNPASCVKARTKKISMTLCEHNQVASRAPSALCAAVIHTRFFASVADGHYGAFRFAEQRQLILFLLAARHSILHRRQVQHRHKR